MKVLHWPKLFEGRVSQEGERAYDGNGYGFSKGMTNVFGYANGNGRGRGYGDFNGRGTNWGNGDGYGNGGSK